MAAHHENGCYEEKKIIICFLVCKGLRIQLRRRGGNVASYSRISDRERVSKQAISSKTEPGVYRRKYLM